MTTQQTAIEKATDEIEQALRECSSDAIRELPQMKQAIKLAGGVRAMRLALSDKVVEELFMPLQGTPLGFRTDKDTERGYPVGAVKECVIEALIRGFQVVGNEFNIIAGRAYFTKEGFERKVRQFPGLTNLDLRPGVPTQKEGGALVPYRATWLLQGKPMELVRDLVKNDRGELVGDERIPIRVNGGMGADAILGKAKRKILAQIFELISGTTIPDGDVIDVVGEVVGTPPRSAAAEATEDLIEKHKAKVAAKKNGEKATSPANADPAADKDGVPEPGAGG